MAVEFLKSPNASPSNFVVDASGKVTGLKLAVGNTVTVYLKGSDNRGNGLTVRESGTSLVTVWTDFNSPANATSAHVVKGSAMGNGKLVALSLLDNTTYAELPFEVGTLGPQHNWNMVQPAPQAMWNCIKPNFRRVRWLGVLDGARPRRSLRRAGGRHRLVGDDPVGGHSRG